MDLQGDSHDSTAEQIRPSIPPAGTASEQYAELQRHFIGDDTFRQTAAHVAPPPLVNPFRAKLCLACITGVHTEQSRSCMSRISRLHHKYVYTMIHLAQANQSCWTSLLQLPLTSGRTFCREDLAVRSNSKPEASIPAAEEPEAVEHER